MAELFQEILHRSQLILISIDFNRLLTMLLFTTPRVAVFSIYMGVDGCLFPIFSRKIRAGIASRQLTKSAQISAYAAEDMTALIICDMVMTVPLLGGVADYSAMKQ